MSYDTHLINTVSEKTDVDAKSKSDDDKNLVPRIEIASSNPTTVNAAGYDNVLIENNSKITDKSKESLNVTQTKNKMTDFRIF